MDCLPLRGAARYPQGSEPGEDWFEWEERPGPKPVSTASHPNDDLVINVCYVSLSETGQAANRSLKIQR
jgi:hypothetical protein